MRSNRIEPISSFKVGNASTANLGTTANLGIPLRLTSVLKLRLKQAKDK